MRQSRNRFLLDGEYEKLLRGNGVQVEEALRKAGLPEDLFRRPVSSMTTPQYFEFIKAAARLSGDPGLAVRIGTSDEVECFSPFIFAAFCGRDGITCIDRISRYKRLISPLVYSVETKGEAVSVEILTETGPSIPAFLIEIEFSFLVHIIRKATREPVKPLRVILRTPEDRTALDAFTGCVSECGERDKIVFAMRDLRLPFISRNDTMWEYFEPELKRRLYELNIDDSFRARVRSALTELFPGGGCGADDAARKLGVSRRTLQRRLNEEDTTFREQLNHVRELLAKHYLRNTELPVAHIAFLLGYRETNSFLHSFRVWTGVTAGEYRQGEKNDS